jgi:hypothetical protein
MKISVIEPGGLNIELAILFASKGHDVGYYSEFREAFPAGIREKMGTGFPGVTRFIMISEALEHGDIIICPDTYSQDYLALARKYSKPTWGAGHAERLEQDRLFGKQMFKSLGLPVGKYYHGTGVDELEYCLKHNKDLYIKFPGAFRGTMETKHHYDWQKTKREWWGQLLSDLGPEMDKINWLAEEPVDNVMEVAVDQMNILGIGSLPTLIGIEAKDVAYLGKIFNTVPPILQYTTDALTPFLRSCQAKTFFSPEGFITKDKKFILSDPCLRTGHPVSSVQLKIYGNLCEYMCRAALNNLPEGFLIKPTHTYGIALEIESEALDDSWLEVQFDPKRRKNVHLQCARQDGDAYFVIPKAFLAATIVGLGNTIEAAEKEVHDTLKDFSCEGIHYDLDALNGIKEQMKLGKTVGINF